MNTSTMTRIVDTITSFLAALGMIALAGAVGLYYGGFFHFLAEKNLGSAVLQFFFGS